LLWFVLIHLYFIRSSFIVIIIAIVTDFDNNSVSLQWGVLASVNPGAAIAAGFPTKPGGYLKTTYGTISIFF
jgi:hypothetical protein